MDLFHLYNDFEHHCDYYYDMCDGDLEHTMRLIKENIYNDMAISTINLIERIIREKNTISIKFSDNKKFIENYFEKKLGKKYG